MKELVAYVRERPDKINYAHSGLGSVAHLCGLMFMNATKTKMTVIPYKGGGEVMKDLLSGTIDVYCEPATGTTANIQAGKIKPYAVTTKRRVAVLPDVPTTAEAGFPEIGITTWYALYAPKGTSAEITRTLNTAVNKVLAKPDVRQRLLDLGFEPAGGSSGYLGVFARKERERWAPIIKAAGIRADQ